MATVRPLGSVSRVAVVMLGEAREAPAAVQARGALVRLTLIAATWAAGPASGGRGWEASEWWGRPTDAGPRQAAFWTWMGVTAAVGRSWLWAVTTGDGREHRKKGSRAQYKHCLLKCESSYFTVSGHNERQLLLFTAGKHGWRTD